MFYDESLVEDIRVQNDIIDVIGTHVKLQKKGSSHFGLCPFHNEKSPSFSVSPDKQMYHCFGCGASGNVFTFVMEYENYSFVEAIKILAERAHITLPEPEMSEEAKKAYKYKQELYDANRDAAKYFYSALHSDKGKKALEYVNNRELDSDTQKKFGLGYAYFFRDDLYKYLSKKGYSDKQLVDVGISVPETGGNTGFRDRFFNRIMFPIIDVHNRVIGFGGRVLDDGMPKYLNSPETRLFDKSKNLYGLNIAKSARKGHIIIAEGYMDVIALHQAGFNQTVASLGTAFTKGQANLLKRYTDQVLISYDSDNAGRNATLRAIPILESVGLVVRVILLGNSKDPDDYIKANGAEAFTGVIENATPAFIFEIDQLELKHDLNDPESKTRFFSEIAKRLVHIENELKRETYLEAIVKKYGLRKEIMVKEVDRIGKNAGIVSETKKREEVQVFKENDTMIVTEKNLLGFIVGHKDIYDGVRDEIRPEMFSDNTYIKLAGLIFEAYETGGSLEPARFLNQFIEAQEQTKVGRVFNHDFKVENQQQMEKMINDLVYKVKQHYIDQKARTVSGPDDMQALLIEKRKLQQLRIELKQRQ